MPALRRQKQASLCGLQDSQGYIVRTYLKKQTNKRQTNLQRGQGEQMDFFNLTYIKVCKLVYIYILINIYKYVHYILKERLLKVGEKQDF